MNFKIIFLGEDSVRKSEFINSIHGISFQQLVGVTGFNFQVSKIQVLETSHLLQFWNLVSIIKRRKIYYQGASGIVLMIDDTSDSFVNLLGWFEEAIQEFYGREYFIILLNDTHDREKSLLSPEDVDKFIGILSKKSGSTVKYLELTVEKNRESNDFTAHLIPVLLKRNKICYNCFKTFETVYYKEPFFFCENCYIKPDFEKASAFFRLSS